MVSAQRIKYPRTPHLPWSPGASSDDVYLVDTMVFEGQYVVVTEKMDGENTTMSRNFIHARSLDSAHHPSRTWAKALHGAIQADIPEGWRICGENLYAKHSIEYAELTSYFMVFSIWNAENIALPWDQTKDWCELLGLCHVPCLYEGQWDERAIRNLYNPKVDSDKLEGYVVRLAGPISYKDFGKSVAKFVRMNHVQTDEHWMTQEVIPNRLKIE